MSLGTLTIDLAANTARLSSDLGKASRLSDKYADDMKKRMERVGAVIGTAVAGLATGAFAGWIKSSIDAADAASKSAAMIGISVESLTALEYAAGLADVSSEALTSTLIKFNKTIDQADRGSKSQAAAFADMGIAVRDANGELKSADGLLLEVADKFAGYQDGAAKSALAQELFGKSGAKMIPLLNSGAQGIQELTAQARQLGLVVSQETASAAEQFNDSLTTMGGVTDGMANQIAAQMLPTMNDFTGLLIDLSTNSDAAAESANVMAGVLKGLASVGIVIGATFKTTGDAIGATASALVSAAHGDFAGAWETIKSGATDYTDTTEAAIDRLNKLWSGEYKKAGEQAAETSKRLHETIKRTATATDEQAAATKAAADAAQRAADAINGQVAALQLQADTLGMTSEQAALYKLAMDGATAAQLTSARAALEQVAAFEKNKTAMEDNAAMVAEIARVQEGTWTDSSKALGEYQEKVETLRKGLLAGNISQENYDKTVTALDEQLAKAQTKNEDAVTEISAVWESAAKNIQSTMADFIFDPFADGLDGMLQGFGTMMQKIIAEAVAADLAKRMFGAAVGGTGDGWVGALGSLFGGGKAVGGPAMAGKMYEVGEYNRPELFTSGGRQYMIPGNSGSVSPMPSGGGGNVYNFDLSGIRNAQEARQAASTLQRAATRMSAAGARYS